MISAAEVNTREKGKDTNKRMRVTLTDNCIDVGDDAVDAGHRAAPEGDLTPGRWVAPVINRTL